MNRQHIDNDLPRGLSIGDFQAVYRDGEGKLRVDTEELSKSGAKRE